MNRKLILAMYIAKVTFKSIWLVFASLFFIVGIVLAKEMGGFGGWMIGGFACTFPLVADLIKEMAKGGKQGEIEGANTYYVRDWGSSLTISNNPQLGWLKGIILSGIVFIAAGLIWLPGKMIAAIIDIVSYSCQISRIRKDIANESK